MVCAPELSQANVTKRDAKRTFFFNDYFRPSRGFPDSSSINKYCSPVHANDFRNKNYQKIEIVTEKNRIEVA